MRFANPHFLWALLAIPVLAALLAWSLGRRRKALERYAHPLSLARMGVAQAGWRAWVGPGLSLLAVTLLIISTARPQWGYEDRRVVSRGVDVLIAIDTSASMLAQDYKPNRLQRAKELLQNILWEVKGDRVGVMAFAGNAVILCPLTLDYSMASTALESVNVTTVATQGTAIGIAIDAATKAFETASAGERVLVLLTDGEDQGTQPTEAAQRAADAKIKVLALGIGDTQGTPIPFNGAYKQDKSGKVVSTRLDFQTLTDIARITGGKAVKANLSGGSEVDAIMNELRALKGTDKQDRIYRVYKERYAWFLTPAILLLLAEALGLGRPRKQRPMPIPAPTAAATLLLLCILAGTGSRSAWAYPGESQVLARKGVQQYNQQQYAPAAESFDKAAATAKNDPALKFNLGAATYKAGKPDEAIQAFGSVFDPANPRVNAAADYNIGVLQHQQARTEIEAKQKEWEEKAGQGDEAAKKEIQQQIEKLQSAADRYKNALLKVPTDHDMKQNYEIARNDLEALEKLLEEQQKEPNEQPQQQQQPQQDNKKQEQQPGDKGEQQDPQQQQGEGEQGEQEQNQPEQNDQKQDQGKQGDKPGEQNPENKEEQEGQGEEKQEPAKPSPTPGQGQPRPTPGAGQPKPDGEEKQVPLGEMGEGDVERLLNSLPAENEQALQRFLNQNYKMRDDMENDW